MYNIIRFYAKGGSKIIKTVDTLEEAQAHCQDEKTQLKGVYFEGYNEV